MSGVYRRNCPLHRTSICEDIAVRTTYVLYVPYSLQWRKSLFNSSCEAFGGQVISSRHLLFPFGHVTPLPQLHPHSNASLVIDLCDVG